MNEKLLNSLREKERRLAKAMKQYEPSSKRDWNIIRAGWAECETMIGIEGLKETPPQENEE